MTSRKHWFMVADSIIREPWDNDVLATVIRLMAYLNDRWARDCLSPREAGRARISITDSLRITGRQRRDYAELALTNVAAVLTLSLTYHRDSIELEWPKFAKFQYVMNPKRARNRPRAGPSDSDSDSDSDSKKRREKRRAEPRPAADAATALPWGRMLEAFGRHGRTPEAYKLTDSRRKSIVARMREGYTEEDFGRAVDGYRAMHCANGSARSNDFDPEKFFTPDTILRAGNFPKYVEAAQQRRESHPWRLPPGTPLPPRVYS